MSLDESLSRLLSDDLPESEAEALRVRIRTEPEVARAYEDLRAVVEGLSGLRSAEEPPALVVREVGSSWVGWGAAASIGALAAVWMWVARPMVPEVTIIQGESTLDGVFSVSAPEHRIELDGRASIFVEPLGTAVREGRVKEDAMQSRDLVAAAGGALLTIVVYEGSARLFPDSGEPTVTVAGSTHSVPVKARLARADVGAPRPDETAEDRMKRLADELAATKSALATERFAGALVRGQLASDRGVPSEWPTDVPPGFSPDAFEAEVNKRIAGDPDLEIAHVDCSEYPCLAAIRYTGPDRTDGWGEGVESTMAPWFEETHAHASISTNRSRFRSDDFDERFVITSVAGTDDEAVQVRRKWRMDELVRQLGEEVDAGDYAPDE